ncbi:inactive protein RESTRICTED TEV MOVEMENT 2-like [Lolium rigidum]|uniref:inactive protein RESTRICTED TEV MOVEMENT 2-like n=1 Tax=Lolium rigidum TaxID=89674 RepID=UPI001F5C18D4|nr:inactive protein RESTRICTED TEV MOVEMENT 2-like [Lolium rigidum]
MASKQRSSPAKAAAADCDPVYEWVIGDGSYLLRLTLPGFKKEDFRVHVDPSGRLTIIVGHRPVDGVAGTVRLHKVFQLPHTSDLDGITGRYDGSALMLTVPKLPSSAVPPPETPMEQVKEAAADVADKPTDKKCRVGREAERLIEAARARLQGRQKEEAATKEQTAASSKKSPAREVDGRKEEPKPEAPATPAEKVMKQEDDHDEKAKAAEHKAKLDREAEQRIEAARARLYAAEREAEREREQNGCWNWKERATEEGLKWAETIGNNKEVIATAVAAFTLGFFVSHRIFSRS